MFWPSLVLIALLFILYSNPNVCVLFSVWFVSTNKDLLENCLNCFWSFTCKSSEIFNWTSIINQHVCNYSVYKQAKVWFIVIIFLSGKHTTLYNQSYFNFPSRLLDLPFLHVFVNLLSKNSQNRSARKFNIEIFARNQARTRGIPTVPVRQITAGVERWSRGKSFCDPLKRDGVRASSTRRRRLKRKQFRAPRWAQDANECRDVVRRRGVDCLPSAVLVLLQRPRNPF